MCEFELHRVMGLMQHHDAVTGTEKQNVAEDYAMRLAAATARCHAETRDTLLAAAGLDPAVVDLSDTLCPRLNVSECEVSELGGSLVIMLVKSKIYFSGEIYLTTNISVQPAVAAGDGVRAAARDRDELRGVRSPRPGRGRAAEPDTRAHSGHSGCVD